MNELTCPHCKKLNIRPQSLLYGKLKCDACKTGFCYYLNPYTGNIKVSKEYYARGGTQGQRRYLYHIERGLCHYCKQNTPFEKSTVDHIIPESKGGSSHPSNLVFCCKHCNGAKGNTNYHDFCNSIFRKETAVYPPVKEYLNYQLNLLLEKVNGKTKSVICKIRRYSQRIGTILF